MTTTEDLKDMVRAKYSEIADQSREQNAASCCGATGCCSTVDYAVFAQDYSSLKGYNPDADLGLGCGVPTAFALIKEGDVVVDLGSGAGNDCFVARALAGETGEVIGVDFSAAMLEKAKENARKLGFTNVRFREGDIEDIPLSNNRADVVISNCVLNLVPNKQRAFAEIFRILRPGGHFSVSDVVTSGDLPPAMQNAAELYAGCVSGAISLELYLGLIGKAGFANISVQQQRVIDLPDEILSIYMSDDEISAYRSGDIGIFSVTVYAEKAPDACCTPGSACC